jgi:hypothetical protein
MEILLDRPQIREGVYRNILSARAPETYAPQIDLIHLEKVVGEVKIAEVKDKAQTWEIEASIPPDCLSDGVQTFLLNDRTSDQTIGSFTVVTGEALEDDLRAEIDLLRAELDLLKKAFRRHCSET